MDIKLLALDPEYFDIDLSKIKSSPLTIGRGLLSGIKDTRCSRNQVQISKGNSLETILLCRTGPNISKINDEILEKGVDTVMKDKDILCLLEDQFAFRLSVNQNESKMSPLPINKLPEKRTAFGSKQTSLAQFFESKPEKKKRKHSGINKSSDNGTKTPEADMDESDDESHLDDVKNKLKRLRENKSDQETIDKQKPELKSHDQIVASHSVWEKHSEFLVYTSKGITSSSKIAAFDIDGTIITTKSGKVFAVDKDDWKIYISGILQRLKQLHANGYKIVFITNQRSIGKGHLCEDTFKSKIEAIIKKCDVPVQVLVGTHGGLYRKPAPGLWTYLTEKANHNISVDYNHSFYVGDAAGRPAKFLPGRKKDFASSDRLFAINLGLSFYTPEEYFLNHKPASFSLPEFNPTAAFSCELCDPSTAKLTGKSTEVIVLVGMPAAGKSHFAQTYLVPVGYAYVNRDTLGSWQKCVSRCDNYLSKGKSVVIDNTNPDVESRKRFIDCAKKTNADCRCFVFHMTIEWAKHNNRFRTITDVNKTHAPVSNTILYSFRKNFKPPTKEEGFSEIVKINFIPKFKSTADENLYKMYLNEK